MKCKEKIWGELADGYFGYETCGGTYEQIGKTDLYQCAYCKKVKQFKWYHVYGL